VCHDVRVFAERFKLIGRENDLVAGASVLEGAFQQRQRLALIAAVECRLRRS
jgi:hypothetical protein